MTRAVREVNVATDRRATPSRIIGRVLCIFGCVIAAWGCTETCLLNGECAADQLCLEGDCRRACSADPDCAEGQYCLGGGCRGLAPGEAPPCRDDAGCADAALDGGAPTPDLALDRAVPPDAALDRGALDAAADVSVDAELVDGAPFDSALLDGEPPDALFDGGQLDGELPDGELPDGALGVDLGGLYTVTSTVVIATGGDLSAGDVEHHIHRLVALGGTRYRLEVFDPEGALLHAAEADFEAPGGEARYQFEYALPRPAPEGCVGGELRFQRGTYAAAPAGHRLTATEERTVSYDGDGCPVAHLVRLDVVWSPLPDPE